MNAPGRRNGGFTACAAILIVAATVTAADARIGLNMSGQTMHGMSTAQATRDWTRGYGPKIAPPYAPPCYYSPRDCSRSSSSDQGGGGTGGFSPGGGSGTKPIKKPNLQ